MKIKLILSVHISAKQKQCRRDFFFHFSSFTRCYTNTLGLYVRFPILYDKMETMLRMLLFGRLLKIILNAVATISIKTFVSSNRVCLETFWSILQSCAVLLMLLLFFDTHSFVHRVIFIIVYVRHKCFSTNHFNFIIILSTHWRGKFFSCATVNVEFIYAKWLPSF